MRPKRSYYFLAVFLLPLLVILQNPQVKEPLRGWTLAVMKPAFMVGKTAADFLSSSRDAVGRFFKAFHGQEANEKRIAELESEVSRLSELAKENERLRKILEFRDSLAGKKIAARILGWDPSPWRKTLILDKGTQHGIRKDMAVLVADGLVGRVVETGPSTARVIMLIDADSRVSGMTQETRAQGLVAGNGGNELTMEYLDLESNVAVGEVVSTSGLNGLYPKGIRIGKIVSIAKDSTGLHLQAKISSFVRFSKLEEVLCLGSSQGK